jgi:hypothetical protein
MKRFAPLGVAVIAALIAQCGRADLGDDGDPWFDWTVNIRDGVSRENFEDSIRRWGESLGDFEDHIDY